MSNLDLKSIINEPPIIGFDYDACDLESVYSREMISDPSEQGLGHPYQNLRRLFFGETEGFKSFYNTVQNSIPSIVEKFVSMDQQQRRMPKRWASHDVKKIASNIKLQMLPVIDMPGYRLGSHLDQRTWFATGLLNVSDNVSVTHFTKKKNSMFARSYYKAEGTSSKGILWLNTESTWHHMTPVPHVRKIIQINLVLL